MSQSKAEAAAVNAGLALSLITLANVQSARKEWQAALDAAIEHVLLVAKNNPAKSIRVILLRPDVREALSEPFAAAGAETVQAIREAWMAQAGDELIPDADLRKLLADARRNTIAMPRAIGSVLRTHTDPETLERALGILKRNYIRRAEFGIMFAAERAKNLRVLAQAKKGYKKQWWSPPHPTQCSFCAALHGKVIPINKEFPHTAGGRHLKPFGGKLLLPPAHPRCRCRIRIIKP